MNICLPLYFYSRPRRGAIACGFYISKYITKFLLTPPQGGDQTVVRRVLPYLRKFLLTPPQGGDPISPVIPETGYPYFYSRPRRGAILILLKEGRGSEDFYSRPRRGAI